MRRTSLHRFPVRRLVPVLMAVASVSTLPAAPPKPTGGANHAVDVVSLKSGRHLRGLIAGRDANVSMAIIVSREWLQTANPMYAAEGLAANQDRCRTAWTETRDRIAERLKSPPDSPQLVFFLKQELERIKQSLANRDVPEPDFLWFDLPTETIAKVTVTTPEQRRVCLYGWSEGIAHVETRDTVSLTKELSAKGVKMEGSGPDLSDRLSARPQSADEWSARMALVEYALGTPVDFQGMGDTFARTGEGQPINLGDVLPKILQQQLGSLLKELTNEGQFAAKPQADSGWLKSVIGKAELAKSKGFRVTRLDIDVTQMQVAVETRFVGQLSTGKWQTIWRESMTEDAAKARPAAERRIDQDPQLKTVIESLKSLGLADARTLQQAIRVGAATMAAQQSADAAFGEFRDRYTRRLDGPPLLLTPIP